jgi:hypothetical protein
MMGDFDFSAIISSYRQSGNAGDNTRHWQLRGKFLPLNGVPEHHHRSRRFCPMLVFPKIIIEAAVQCYHRQLLKVSNFTKTNLKNEFPNFIPRLLYCNLQRVAATSKG